MQAEVIQGFRLSPQQKRLWLQQSQGPAYKAQAAIEIEGALATDVLKRALTQVATRNEILRTKFSSLAGMKLPVQVIVDSSEPVWRRIDLSGSNAQSLSALLDEDRRAAFDPNGGQALRCTLVCLSTDRHLLFLTVPSLCADSRSLVNLTREIARCYAGTLSEESVQYVQFAEWQNDLLEADEAQLGLEFWRNRSMSEIAAVALPFENPFENKVTETSEFEPALWTETSDWEVVSTAAIRHGVSVERLLLACWQTFISRLTNQPNVAMSFRCDGRVYEEMHEAIGLYEKWLPVHSFLGEDFQFGEIVRQVNATVEKALEWQEYFTPNPSDTATIAFSFEELPEAERAGDLSFRVFETHSCTERFKLKLSCVKATGADKEFKLEFGYDAELFSEQSIRVIARQFKTLLEHSLQTPELPIGKLRLLGELERQQLLIEWNDTRTDFHIDRCLSELFAAQVERTPEAPAVSFEGDALNYRDLDRRSNQLAHYLCARGVAAETRVAVCLERSIDMLVAVLGIWKSGGTYVPLDPMQPKKRLDFMIQDAQTRLVLSHSRLKTLLANQTSEVLYLDSERQNIEQENDRKPELSIGPGNLAYVIYTSGSTGQPKGAMIEHRSVVNLALSLQQEIYGSTGTTLRVSLNAPLAFDSSMKQIVQLLSGHSLHVLPEEVRRDGQALHTYLQHHQIDVFDCTPSQLSLLVQSPWAESATLYPGTLLVGGEAMSQDLWRTLAQRQGMNAYNVYGPTECTVDATARRIANEKAQPTIGKPWPNVQTYVLDDQMQPVPVGAVGELYIGGAGLARGYLGRPDVTADKFKPHPYSHQPGARLYRTGDRVRYTACGELEFLGRVDHQVKIRGSRIELGEIEVALLAHPDIREAVVIVRESGPDDKRLVAYLVSGQSAPSHHELHAFLHDYLPDYMLPTTFVALDALPLMPNGKVDRRALPEPEQSSKSGVEYVAPSTATETSMAEIWARVLGTDRVGISDNFFELGGHSLLATQVISQVRHAFEVEIPLRNIFETPTVAGLAESVERARATSSTNKLPELRPIPRDGDLPLSFAQQRLWFLDQLDPANIAYNNPYAVRLSGALDHHALERSLSEIVRRHEVLRTTFTTRQGKTVQVINSSEPWVLELRDLQALPDEEREAEARRLAFEEAQRPFDLQHGPLLRTNLLRLDQQQHILLLTMHHIVFDAWSIGIFLQEIGALYQAFVADQPSPLPELPVQYADFANWQTNLLQGDTLAGHVSYWRTQLDGVATLELPTDRPRPAMQTFKGAHQSFSMSASLAESVHELGRKQGVTLFMTLLAAFQILLHRYTSQVDISVGTPIANRNYREIEGLIGFFINTLVLRTDLSGDPRFHELLQRVRDTALNAYTHQDLPFEKLVEELQPERNLGRTPYFQVLFTVRNISSSRLSLPDLLLEGLDIETGTSKFDLLMLVDETEQGINFGFEYNTDLFDNSTIARVARHFENLLAGIVAAPDCRLSHLPLLDQDEERQLVYDWNATDHFYPSDQCIHRMFEEQVERTPDAVALAFEDTELTYRTLNERANQLAHYLKELGVGPDVFVGILLERSIEMMVSVLAVMKSGGAYLALEPAYPRERIAYMLEDSKARVMLSQKLFSRELADMPIPVVLLDSDWTTVSEKPAHNPDSKTFSDNLVYATYTSGSTGKPKGIAMPHRAVRNLLEWQFCETHLPPGARTLQFASLSFDVSFQDMFSTWGSGGAVVLVTGEARRDLAGLAQVLVAKEIDRLFIPAVALQQLAEGFCANDRITAPLRKVIAGSEQLQITRSLTRMFTELPDCTLHNEYGPSETHVVTELKLPQSVAEWPERPAVGKPIYNTQIYILDPHLKPVPIGVSGELFLGGAGVSRGYLGRPDLTAEKFVPDPFSQQPGQRLYRTGDLGRWLADGNVVFLGRMDFQVKIRGFRVEPGEIEVALNSHAAVRETIVLAREDEPGKRRLVAYIVLSEDSSPTVSELRSFLLTTLPDYMVPSVFVFLDALPLTPNGKVNRKALPIPDQSRPELERAYVAPRTALEQVVAECWANVLGLERVGVNDDFFDLGGHSLLATQVIGRLREVFPVELPLRSLFEAPTVAGLTERMTQESGDEETLEEIAQTLQAVSELSDSEVEVLLTGFQDSPE
jgi:amino acid adenylation domain-containing protein